MCSDKKFIKIVNEIETNQIAVQRNESSRDCNYIIEGVQFMKKLELNYYAISSLQKVYEYFQWLSMRVE